MWYRSEADRWWWSDQTGPMPGVVVPFFGAGISIDPPTCLPSGLELTNTLVKYLMDDTSAENVLTMFKDHSAVTGRPAPRLEHLLSIAIRANDQAAQLLEIFRSVVPNRMHYVLAEQITRQRGWAVTTNFDECVERASGWSIPVHVFDPDTDGLRVRYGPEDADWGLIKVHGTIGDGAGKLGATIEQLAPGLTAPTQQLLDRVFSKADFVVVAGYSGSDHFDINRYLQLKLNQRFKARLLWLQHSSDRNMKAMFPSSRTFPPSPGARGLDSFETAFTGVKSFSGTTSELLGEILGCSSCDSLEGATPKLWRDSLAELYKPSKVDKLRNAALLGAAIGSMALIDVSIPLLRYELESEDVGLLELATSLELRGHWKIARAVLRRHHTVSGESTCIRIATNIRRSGKPLRALVALLLFHNADVGLKRAAEISMSEMGPAKWRRRLEMRNCLLDMWRIVRRARIGRTRLVSFTFSRLIDVVVQAMDRSKPTVMSAEAESDWQLGQLRAIAYGEYAHDDREAGEFWQIIEAEMVRPNFITQEGPLFHGFYINSATTNTELDQIATLFEVRLAYADILVAGVRNNYLDRWRILSKRMLSVCSSNDEWAWSLRSELYDRLYVIVGNIKLQFKRAREAAAMLDNDEIYSRLSRSWLTADRAVAGFSTWEPQRVYLPGLSKSELAKREAGIAS
jgi:hypothetical protein